MLLWWLALLLALALGSFVTTLLIAIPLLLISTAAT